MATEASHQSPATANGLLASRVVAAVADGVICFLIGAALVQLPGLKSVYAVHDLRRHTVPASGFVARGILLMIVMLLYWGACEIGWDRTPGKSLFHLRVVDERHGPASTRQIVIRTALRIIDVLPAGYLFGFVAVLLTRQRAQRIGDLLARTHVVFDAEAT